MKIKSTFHKIIVILFIIILSLLNFSLEIETCNCVEDDLRLIYNNMQKRIYSKIKKANLRKNENVTINAAELFDFKFGRFMFLDPSSSSAHISKILPNVENCSECIETNLKNEDNYYLIVSENEFIYPVLLDKKIVKISGEYGSWHSIDETITINTTNKPAVLEIQ